MRCPFCAHLEDKVVDSREGKDGRVIRRRRECLKCRRRSTTYERPEESVRLLVIKKDDRREPYDRNKITAGLRRACEKRPVSPSVLEAITDEIEQMMQDSPEREISTQAIGEKVMERLRSLDTVAYVRFASVYRQFQDVDQFMRELKEILEQRK